MRFSFTSSHTSTSLGPNETFGHRHDEMLFIKLTFNRNGGVLLKNKPIMVKYSLELKRVSDSSRWIRCPIALMNGCFAEVIGVGLSNNQG